MRWLLTPAAITLLGASAAACGSASRGADSLPQGSAAASTVGYLRGDYDDDDNGGADLDDHNVRTYGRDATTVEARDVAALVKRYYVAGAADDGAGACSLMDLRLAKSADFAKVVPQDYAPSVGSSVLRDKNCAQVASLLFGLNRQELVADASTIQVVGLRVDGAHGLALLIFKTTAESEIPVERERGAWKIDAFLGGTLP